MKFGSTRLYTFYTRRRAGFTLLEAMVSLILFATVVGILASLFTSSTNTTTFIEGGEEAVRQVRSLRSALAGDIEQAIVGTVAVAGRTMTLKRLAPSTDLGNAGVPGPSPAPSPWPAAPTTTTITWTWDGASSVTRSGPAVSPATFGNVTNFSIQVIGTSTADPILCLSDTTYLVKYNMTVSATETRLAKISGAVRPLLAMPIPEVATP